MPFRFPFPAPIRFCFPGRRCLAGLSWLIGTTAGASSLPPWLLGDETCSATLVTPRVAISSYYCLGHVRPMWDTDAFVVRQWSTGASLPGHVRVDLTDTAVTEGAMPGRQLALFVLDQPLPAFNEDLTPLPSYPEEARLIKDPGVSPTGVARRTILSVYVPGRPDYSPLLSDAPAAQLTRFSTYVQVRNSTHDIYATIGDRPLVYRSVRALRAEDPQRFEADIIPLPPDDGPGVEHLRRSLQLAMNGEQPSDSRIDDTLLTTVGTAADLITRIWSDAGLRARSRRGGLRVEFPFRPGTSGAGLLASRGELRDKLVGLVTNDKIHLRLSAFWPAIYRELMAQGLKEDAMFLAGRLLEQPSGTSPTRSARIGDVRYYDSPYSGRVEFFRLVALGADGTAGTFPMNAGDNAQWQYLGTDLPGRRAVVRPDLRPVTNRFANWTPTPPLGRLPGTHPAPPATSAAR